MFEYADCLDQVLMFFSYELLLSSAVCTESVALSIQVQLVVKSAWLCMGTDRDIT